jgi:hypothetical protein
MTLSNTSFISIGSIYAASVIVPSSIVKVFVLQYGHVSGISSVSGSMEMILWLRVVAHGPLHTGQFTITVSISGH